MNWKPISEPREQGWYLIWLQKGDNINWFPALWDGGKWEANSEDDDMFLRIGYQVTHWMKIERPAQ